MEILLEKMKSNYLNPEVEYFLGEFKLSDKLGKKLKIEFNGKYTCIYCGQETKKLFGEGFCYSCFQTAPEAEVCNIHPEKCQAHEGIARDMEWAKKHCLIPHYVYLAKTNQIKVGVTRSTQVPIRWIDQGADFAIKLAKTPYRQLAGEIEVFLKQFYSDKTQWQSMLKNISCEEDLIEQKNYAQKLLREKYEDYIVLIDQIYSFTYPYLETPTEINTLKLDESRAIEGILTGIKGQYIILDNKNVINIRSHSGYNVVFEVF